MTGLDKRHRWINQLVNGHERTVDDLPSGYRAKNKWLPHVGDIVPNFHCNTTKGPLDFYEYAEGKWTVLFNQPFNNGPVCMTEMAVLASGRAALESRNAQLLGVVHCTGETQVEQFQIIEETFGEKVSFPMALDANYDISETFGMSLAYRDWASKVRKIFLISPALKISCIWEYPVFVGRSMTELLRVLDAQRLHDMKGLVTPCDWRRGDMALVPPQVDDEEAITRFGDDIQFLAPNLRLVPT